MQVLTAQASTPRRVVRQRKSTETNEDQSHAPTAARLTPEGNNLQGDVQKTELLTNSLNENTN